MFLRSLHRHIFNVEVEVEVHSDDRDIEFIMLKHKINHWLSIQFDDDGNLDFLIEYQGRQHYEASNKFGGKRGLYQQQFNDNKKRRYCALHGINLIEIPYTEEYLIDYDYIMNRAGY